MPDVQHYIDATNEFCSLTPRERSRRLPEIEKTIAELMDARPAFYETTEA